MYDLLVRGGSVVGPEPGPPRTADVAVRGGVIVALGSHLPGPAAQVVDADGLLVFPGAVDAHQHWGIYNQLDADAELESAAAAQGGVTTGLSYMRTGQYYLNRSGAYAEFFPQVLAQAAGRSYVDYGFHLAPMMNRHIEEIPELIDRFGVTSFKIFMFYGGHGLHGRSADQSAFLMTPPDERYDLAHFESVMRGVQAARAARPALASSISLSLHCETAEIMTAYTRMVEQGDLTGLAAYSASRPAHSEGLAVTIASYLAYETALPTINLLHLSSAKALDAAMLMATTFPEVDFRREVTIGHLMADIETASGIGGKVNPPLRPRSDVEALWRHLLAGNVDWVASDHACCRAEQKFGDPAEDVFLARSGFGGVEYLLPGLLTEGVRRGLSHHTIACLSAANPADRFGLGGKGRVALGYDADLALIDPDSPWTVRARDSLSQQEYTPFEGMRMTARVVHTFVRGRQVLDGGKLSGPPAGRYVARPSRPVDPR
ncbi:dihydroorotase family protein [Plantactinospora sp. KBS50]|uniref:dihydroorotase n=1 Tax=Plantactinospora sp. KBS50 TaxID=2024580 RepID=UPI000BAB05B1|nr:dihydroorotase family protein [Plantactinospora sp. KBS50]ASW56598.1 hydantoinase [Plantactinospora sp. KBS50]